MKKLIVSLFTIGMLVACGQQSHTAADGYYFEKAEFTNLTPTVEIVLVKSHDEMAKLVNQKSPRPKPEDVMAFSVLSKRISDGVEVKCTIYMIDPKIQYAPEYIGHELVHCLYGNWHTIQP